MSNNNMKVVEAKNQTKHIMRITQITRDFFEENEIKSESVLSALGSCITLVLATTGTKIIENDALTITTYKKIKSEDVTPFHALKDESKLFVGSFLSCIDYLEQSEISINDDYFMGIFLFYIELIMGMYHKAKLEKPGFYTIEIKASARGRLNRLFEGN